VTTELTRDAVVPAKLVGHLFTVEAKIDGEGPFRFTADAFDLVNHRMALAR
jgi:hypothetical protein